MGMAMTTNKNKPKVRNVKVTKKKLQKAVNRAAANEKSWVTWDSSRHNS